MKAITQRLDIVDFLRGFSIFTIVIMHLLQLYPISPILLKASSFGGAGVHVFILCSGFGLYLSYLNKPLSYPEFLKRRLFKVYLPYIIVILLSALIPFYNTSPDKWLQLFSHLFLYKMFVENYECSYGIQFWFISTIIQFYLFWPLVLRLFKRGVYLALFISLLWTTIIGICDLSDERIWNSFFLQYLWEFVLGMKIALFYKNRPQKFHIPTYKWLIPIGVIGSVLTGITGVYGGILKSYNDIPSLFGYMSLSLFLYKIAIKPINNFFTFTSKVSYEWYLVHMLIFGCCNYYLQQTELPIIIQALIGLFLSYLCAIIYHQILHKFKLI